MSLNHLLLPKTERLSCSLTCDSDTKERGRRDGSDQKPNKGEGDPTGGARPTGLEKGEVVKALATTSLASGTIPMVPHGGAPSRRSGTAGP
jgi:hypothetical protein